MKIPFLTALFKHRKTRLKLPESILVNKIKQIACDNNMLVYVNATIYHHTDSFFIPLLILDPERGLFIFEFKEWSYDELSNSTIQKATDQIPSKNNLAFEKAHDIIKKRFNELTHGDGVNVYNYLIMENLNTQEYEDLNVSFKELLPSQKVIFNDTSEEQILNRLHSLPRKTNSPLTPENIIGSLLVQYSILKEDTSLTLCNEEQVSFIDSDIFSHSTLVAQAGSGATSIVLLKAILEKLKNSSIKILIIKPTLLACEILKKQLLETVEHAIVEIDLTSIEIVTPTELLNKHLIRLSKEPLNSNEIHIDKLLMEKKINLTDLILCDDADLFPTEFINYLKHLQKKSSLLLVGDYTNKTVLTLQNSFRLKNQEREFLKTNPHAKAMQIISKLLETGKAKDIMVVSNSLSKEQLNEDLKSFILDKAILLDSSKNLIDQDIDSLLLATYNDIIGINTKYIILLDACQAQREYLNYAFTLCDKKVYVLYEEECQEIEYLKENNENS